MEEKAFEISSENVPHYDQYFMVVIAIIFFVKVA